METNFDVITAKQVEVSEKLSAKLRSGQGVILSAPVGSGKTQTASRVIASYDTCTALILVPQSVISQWLKELNLILQDRPWTSTIYHGKKQDRILLLKNLLKSDSEIKICMTTIETYYSDDRILSDVSWTFCIIDEIHRIRNPNAKMYLSLLKVACIKLGLTGTLVTANAHDDLPNLLKQVDQKGYEMLTLTKSLSRQHLTQEIAKRYVEVITRESLQIRTIPKIYSWVYLTMTPAEEEKYKSAMSYFELTYQELHSVPEGHPLYQQKLQNYWRSLRNLQMVESYAFIHEIVKKLDLHPERKQNTLQRAPLTGKIIHFVDFVKRENPQTPILVFDDYETGLQVLLFHLKEDAGRNDVALYTGSLSREQKDETIEKFLSGEIKILLMTKKAGGVGLNLQIATHIIFLSTSFHSVDEHQAIGRADRMTSRAKNIKVSYWDYPGAFSNIRSVVHAGKDQHARAVENNEGIEALADPGGYYSCVRRSTFEKIDTHWTELKRRGIQRGSLVKHVSANLKGEVTEVRGNLCKFKTLSKGIFHVEKKQLLFRVSDTMRRDLELILRGELEVKNTKTKEPKVSRKRKAAALESISFVRRR